MLRETGSRVREADGAASSAITSDGFLSPLITARVDCEPLSSDWQAKKGADPIPSWRIERPNLTYAISHPQRPNCKGVD